MSDRREFRDLASREEAHDVVGDLDITPPPERVPLADANGRVLAERIDATIDVPGFDRAAMDGYAVRAEDTVGADEADPVVLSVVGTVHAGERPEVTVEPETAVEISTGAVMPEGADAVVIVERTSERDGGVAVRESVTPGENVMLAGTDVAAGMRALGPGTRLSAREIGLLSALGIDEVPVRGRPQVGIISTGDELVRPGGDLAHDAGQIYDVNSYTLASAVEEAGGDPALYPHVGDDFAEMERQLQEAATECDLVLTSGSTSASAVDVVYRVIEERGELHLHGVAIKPGKPMLVGEIGETAYVGLPGYPVSALSIFGQFVAPLVRDAAGLDRPRTQVVTGEMAVRERYGRGRHRLVPVGLVEDADGDVIVYPVDKGSGATTSLVEADGIVDLPAETAYLAAGETVEVEPFSPDVRIPSLLGVGEDDPLLWRLLDRLDRPRYLSVGSGDGLRRFRDGVPDVVVVAGPMDGEVDGTPLGSWEREWGLVVPAGNPDQVDGLATLVDEEVRFVNGDQHSGLRASLDEVFTTLAAERGEDRRALTDAISGYDVTTKAHEGPARKVAAGDADAGLGLRATAAALDLGFVPLGIQTVRVLADPARTEKDGVRRMGAVLDEADEVAAAFAGIRVVETDGSGSDAD